MENHFADVSKMVTLGGKANRKVGDYMLTHYAYYLIAESGDPCKEQIAFAQSYFETQIRKQKLIKERISYTEVEYMIWRYYECIRIYLGNIIRILFVKMFPNT